MARHRRHLASAILASAMLLLASTGCAHTYNRDYIAPGTSSNALGWVAVIPFDNLTTYPDAGEIVSRLVTTELYAQGFQLVDEHEVRKLLSAQRADPDHVLSLADLQQICQQLGATTLITGGVGEYRYKRDLGEDPVVGYTLRAIRAVDGRLLWTTSHSRAEYGIFYHDHHLHENAQRIAEDMVAFFVGSAGQPKAQVDRRASPQQTPEADAEEATATAGNDASPTPIETVEADGTPSRIAEQVTGSETPVTAPPVAPTEPAGEPISNDESDPKTMEAEPIHSVDPSLPVTVPLTPAPGVQPGSDLESQPSE